MMALRIEVSASLFVGLFFIVSYPQTEELSLDLPLILGINGKKY